jgi:hypothetical protein
MVMVVADPVLVQRRAVRRFDPAEQAGRGKRVQYVVHRLRRNPAESVAGPRDHVVDPEMVAGTDGFQDRQPGRRNPQADLGQPLCGRALLGNHVIDHNPGLERVKKTGAPAGTAQCAGEQ